MSYQTSKEETGLGCLSLLLLLPISFFLGAFTISKFWGWYIVPITHFVPLTLWQALGLSLTISLFQHYPDTKSTDKTPKDTVYSLLAKLIMRYGFAWSMAGVLHWFAQ